VALESVPLTAGSIVAFVSKSAMFLVVLFLKLCYSTALYATLAEVNRRITVFRQGRRPVMRALLLLPTVVLFCSAVLFALNFFRVVFGGVGAANLKALFNPADFIFVFLRVGFILAAVVLGGALGIMTGRAVPVGRDRFGGLLYRNRGRYLGFWLFTFTLCGFFRILPWGFVTYWTIWLLVLAACLVTAAHWTLYGACRSLVAAPGAGLPPGDPLTLSLGAPEAVVLSALLQNRGPLSQQGLARALAQPDPSCLAHPAWTEACEILQNEPTACAQALQKIETLGLATQSARGWSPAGAALRLRSMGFSEETASLTVKREGNARTVILQRQGATALLIEPGPLTLSLRELPAGSDAIAGLAEAAEG
jgi:hypothetical protein